MSVFKESARVVSGTVFGYLTIPQGDIVVPEKLKTFDFGFASIISINSAADLSAITFTIVGSFRGKEIREEVQGANAGSATTNYFYDKIISFSASAASANTFTVSIGSYSIVVFDTYNTTNSNNINYNKIDVLIGSLGAGVNGWGKGNYFVYGVSGERPDIINKNYIIPNLTYQPDPPNALVSGYPPSNRLTFINDILDEVTQAKLRSGYYVSTTYPYNSIIVCFTSALVTSTYLEIAQS